MQILGLSDSTPRTEGRLKALFWPTIRNDGDLEYITEQGFWVCFIVAVLTLVFNVFTRSLLLGGLDCLFYFLAGVGVRQRSNVAAITAFVAYVLAWFVIQRYTGNGFSVIRLIFSALLLSNIRGIWLSSRWEKTAEGEAAPPRLNQTIFDKLSDQLPPRIWPAAKWVFGFVAAIEIALLLMFLTAPLPPAMLRGK
jgi:hypothetical protein